MLRLLADENFDNAIVRGVLRRNPDVDLLRAQDVGLTGVEDTEVLAWAAHHGRVLLSHDVATITKHAYERLEAGLSMPGVFEVSQSVPVGVVIEDVLLIAEASAQGEWEGQVRYMPLRR